MSNERLKGHLDLLLLEVLALAPAHGYQVIVALRELSQGAFDLPEGTVYPALHRLEHAGLVTSEWAVVDGRRRRVYRLGPAGRSALKAERAQWRRFSRGVAAVMEATP